MKKILVIADMSGKKQAAIHRGLGLARRSGAAMHIVAFVYDAYISEQENEKKAKKLKQELIKARSQQIDQFIKTLDTGNVKTSSQVVWEKNIAQWIEKNATSEKFGTIVKTGHRTENIIHTPTDWRILRQSNSRVMIVAEKTWRKKNTILCAIDLSKNDKKRKDLNRHIIAEAKSIADLFEGQLVCCYAIPLPVVLIDLDILDRRTILKKATKEASQHFAELAAEFGLDKGSLHIKGGNAEKVIPSISSKLKATMVVLSTSGRKGLKGKLLGNTAEKVLHHLRTDVLALKYK